MKRPLILTIVVVALFQVCKASDADDIANLTAKSLLKVKKEFQGQIAKVVYSFPDEISDGVDDGRARYKREVAYLRSTRDAVIRNIDDAAGMLAKYPKLESRADKAGVAFVTLSTLFELYRYERTLSEFLSRHIGVVPRDVDLEVRMALARVRADVETSGSFTSTLLP